MITEMDLREAIAECQGERNPDAHTCIKLAAYYTILNNMNFDLKGTYSRAEAPEQVSYKSGSDFAEVVRGLYVDDVLDVMDELMDTIRVLMPKLYRATMEKLRAK